MKRFFKSDFVALFKLSTPVMIGMLMQSLFAMVDLFFVAKLGTVETAAASLGGSAFWTMISMTVVVTSATMAIIARAKGAGDHGVIRQFGSLTALLSAVLGLVMGLLLVIFQKPILVLLYNPQPDTLLAVSAYLNVLFWGFLVFFIGSNGRSMMQAMGDTITPLWVFGGANIVNVILDPIFIFTLDMGIAGAALATVIANVIACIWIYWLIIKRYYDGKFSVFTASITLKTQALWSIVKIGFWDALQAVARPITGMLMFRMVYQLGGNAATAAFGIGGQLFNYTFIILAGLSVSISIITGQSLGAGDVDGLKRLMRDAFLVASINMAFFALPYLLWAKPLFMMFRNDPEILFHGLHYLYWVYPGVCFVIFPTIYGGMFKGAGATREPMVASMVANVVLKLPLAYGLAWYTPLGIEGIWLAISLSVVVEALIIIYFYKKGNWEQVKAY